jgi:hypothetical protein
MLLVENLRGQQVSLVHDLEQHPKPFQWHQSLAIQANLGTELPKD